VNDRAPLLGKRLRAVELLAQGLSTSEVAEKLGVSDRTVRRWLHDPQIRAALDEVSREALDRIKRRLFALGHHACEALREVLRSPDAPPAAKVSSARAVLEYLVKLETLSRLQDLEERVRALEERMRHDRPWGA